MGRSRASTPCGPTSSPAYRPSSAKCRRSSAASTSSLKKAPARALVTAPIDKARCRAEGFLYPGHTEYLAARAGVDDFAMLMAGDRLRVVLATIHLPLREVPDAPHARRDHPRRPPARPRAAPPFFRSTRRRSASSASTRTRGERGLLGAEESTVITPAIHQLRAWGRRSGASPAPSRAPLAADTAFPWHASGRYHGLVAMYHDQGLAPFKLMHMHDGVNMTPRAPLRPHLTGPRHRPATSPAAESADPSSFFAAVAYARGEAHRQAAS
jgi:4-hydroxy-L-threonine phosphate dehydrogenase PdxA